MSKNARLSSSSLVCSASSSSSSSSSSSRSNSSSSPPPGGPATDAATTTPTSLTDRLLTVFATKDPSKDWRKLIGGSAEWPKLRASVLQRADAIAAAERDPAQRLAARRFARKLRAVSDELESYDKELERYLTAPEAEWEPMVAAGRARLPVALFEHAAVRCRGIQPADSPARRRLVEAVTRLGALTTAFDSVDSGFGEEEKRAMADAALEFDALLKAAASLPEAEKRIDDLAASGHLTPALMLTMAKAYAAAKESTYTRDDAKEVMVHLYTKAKASFNAQRPAELRILKHLVWLKGETDLRSALREAFEEDRSSGSSSPSSSAPSSSLLVTEGSAAERARARGGRFDAAGDVAAERARLERELAAAQARAKEAARLEAAPIARGAVDYLSTTPPKLLKAVESILRAYDESLNRGGLGDPAVIGASKGQRARSKAAAGKLQATSPEAVEGLRRIRAMILKEWM